MQTPYDTVKYINDELTDYTSTTYNKFLIMVMNLNPIDPNKFKDSLDSFDTIYFDVETKGWHVEKYEHPLNFTSQQMYEFNPSDEIIEEGKKGTTIFDKTKKLISDLNNNKVNKNITKFKDKGKNDRNTKR